MADWISGCHIMKYNLPLTFEELEQLHKARWRKENRKLVTKMAQEEAKERAKERKQGGAMVPLTLGISKCHKFSIIIKEKDDDEETPQPFIAIQLGNESVQTYAFIGFGVDGNTIFNELSEQLKNVELKETMTVF